MTATSLREAALGHDVLPGQAYEFTVEIATPRKPGNYLLELGLVSIQTSFADQGTAPLRAHPGHVPTLRRVGPHSESKRMSNYAKL